MGVVSAPDTTDVANFTPPATMTPTAMQGWLDTGVQTVGIGASYGQVADAQAALAQHYGFNIEAYGFPEQLLPALEFALRWPTKLFWIDLEEDPGTQSGEEYITNAIAVADHYLLPHGIESVLYTRPGWWAQYMGGSTNTFGKRLIYADYNGKAYIDWPNEHFGGWTAEQVVRKQYSKDGLAGVNCDLSISNKPEADVTPEEVQAAIEANNQTAVYPKITALLVNAGQQGATIRAIGTAFADHVANHPGGGATATMAAQLDDMMKKLDAMEQADAKFAADIATIQAKVKAIGAAASDPTPPPAA